jgi:hypothetical protein
MLLTQATNDAAIRALKTAIRETQNKLDRIAPEGS